MKGFRYCDESTEYILRVPLILCNYGTINDISASGFEDVSGSSTISRQIVNEYGMKMNKYTFNYALCKSDFSPFNNEEQIEVESWLTSNTLSSKLEVFDYDGCSQPDIYIGKFINTEWVVLPNGWSGVKFSFQCAYPYPKTAYAGSYLIDGEMEIVIDCMDSGLNKYIYPTVTFTQDIGISNNNEDVTLLIKNSTDNDNEMGLIARDGVSIRIDTSNCIISDETNSGIISFKDIGWDDVGNIYWLRLLKGQNILSVEGHDLLEIEYECYIKKVGAWL